MAAVKAQLGEYPDEGSLYWAYTAALLAYRAGEGSADATKKRLRDARAANARAPDLLASDKPMKPSAGGYVTFGGDEEAAHYAREFGAAWRKTPGAVEWLTSAMSELSQA